ncbi:MAG: SDR family oxidoreductase [Proteobacteria bacterium]|nr:SDR family oxidoreductase [Pseudomonadota bacterium]MBI3499354.1 SDR family oxidoreductase [Pseudomonadota bacterium]
MEIDCRGQKVLVTAGGGGIGRVIAETFQENGASVHVCDIDETALADLRAMRPEIGTSKADVAQAGEVDRLFEEALGRLGGLDVLVNNAGIAGPTAWVEDVSPAEWDRTIGVCLNGMFYCVRRAVPVMKEARQGCIINISSTSGRLAFPMRAPYAVAKWAVNGFTNTLASELGPFNIRVNSILPGWVEGERAESVMRNKAAALGISVEEMKAKAMQFIALKTQINPREIAEMAVYVASRSGRHISGQMLGVCGFIELER